MYSLFLIDNINCFVFLTEADLFPVWHEMNFYVKFSEIPVLKCLSETPVQNIVQDRE